MNLELLNAIEATGSRSEKEKLLADADDATQALIKYALDPFTTFGVTLDHAAVMHAQTPRPGRAASSDWWQGLTKILDQLAQRDLTGHAAVEQLETHFAVAPSSDHAEWGLRVLHKDLRCGVSTKTVVKVFPGLIQPFEVALAQSYEPKKHKLEGVGYIEPKLDGLRVTVVDGVGYTRNGNPIQGADAMLAELALILEATRTAISDWVFDGEFIGNGTFEETVSAARRSGQDDRGLIYHVFDMVRRAEWFSRQTRPFSARRKDIEQYVRDGKYVRRVPSIRVQDPTMVEVLNYRDKFMKDGFEGAMWKADVPYAFKRSKALLKLKKFETDDGTIVDAEEGTGKYRGMLGALVVKLESGKVVNVGSGYTDEQRQTFWRDQTKLKGKIVEIQYQNETSKGSLRFPVFLRFRPDK